MSDHSTSQTATISNPEAERALIGSVIYSGGRALDHLEFDPADYHEPRYEQIHLACQQLKDQGRVVDIVSIDEALRVHSGGESQAATLHQLAAVPSTPDAADYYASVVATHAARRRITTMAHRARMRAETGEDPEAIIAEAHQALEGIRTATGTDETIRFIGETLPDTIEELLKPPRFVRTPWPELDDLIGGFRPGALYVVGARPGVGKSLVALESALSLAQHGSVALFSLEMPEREVHQRALANVGRIENTRLINHALHDDDLNLVSNALTKLADVPIAVRDGSATVAQIRRFAAALHRRMPMAGIILDYLQLVKAPEGDRRNRNEQIQEVSQTLKALAIQLDIPIIAMAQLNREAERREGKVPMVSDLRDSGSVEQDADVVMLLHRAEDQPWDIDIAVGKNRHGRTDKFTLDFRGYNSRITSPSQRGR